MEQEYKEIYWSRFASEFEEKQSQVVGREILFLMQEELLKENDIGEVKRLQNIRLTLKKCCSNRFLG